jgi:hypothetical protein
MLCVLCSTQNVMTDTPQHVLDAGNLQHEISNGGNDAGETLGTILGNCARVLSQCKNLIC